MIKSEIIASLVLDMINQQYPTESDLFQYKDVSYLVQSFYHKALNDRFKELKKLAYKSGNSIEHFPDNWYSKKIIKNKDGKFVLPDYVSFDGDENNSGIKNVTTTGDSSCDIIVIPFGNRNSVRFAPGTDTNIYLYVDSKHLRFANESRKNSLKEIEVRYIPGATDECGDDIDVEKSLVPEILASEIMVMTYNFMINGKNQTPIIDKTNNNNPNKTPTSEIDPTALQYQKQ